MKKNPKISLKFKSKKVLELCVALSILIHTVVFLAFKKFEPEVVVLSKQEMSMEVQDIPETEQSKKPPPPSTPSVPVESEDEELLDDITIEDTMDIDFTTFEEVAAPKPPTVEEEEIPPFLPLEDQPKIIGGDAAILKHLKYPEIALKAQIEGQVVIQFVVSKEGVPGQFNIIKTLNKACDEAAIEALKKVRFTPAKQRDKPVPYRMSYPIRFVLK